MTTTQRLDLAVAVLDGTVAVPVEQRVVVAAHLARSGLERAVAEVLATRGVDLRRARMTSRLTVLDSLVGTHVGAPARLAWGALSRACHRHAFEFPPSEGEIHAWIVHVRGLVASIPTEA